ncbi:hypothetical protein ACFSKI_20490 [Pseudogracilibacillus auburnensis]|uniref:Uncharacterized protein n=1 Tax=Pseudogracilibacillus auburnensis TaxID=1494959 RepID=A0A2V3VX22_9BACI|nr:hypothetical protein [Pseudogracilibacillus auburnensis]MBO1003475.1 hypothetical protein [Pseudogracilibacillus auburnensis]PXW86537.1 hypothetical protein DFR56_10756 [Pseudogracilibacillus auburnensis]
MLRGNVFDNVIGIDDKSLKETYSMLVSVFSNDTYVNASDDDNYVDLHEKQLKRNQAKYFLITKEIQQSRTVDYRNLLDVIGIELLPAYIFCN